MATFWFFAALAAMGIVSCGLQLWAVRSYAPGAKNKKASEGGGHFPPVSILKPLKGLDDNLFDNLESFCKLDYPEYEIIFALQDINDLAFKVASKIKLKYPDKDISIVVQRCEEGLNPKVNNLIPARGRSKHEYILISDSNVCVRKEYLKRIMARMQEPGAGLVTNLVEGVGARSLGSVFENLHLNSFIMGSVCFLDKFMGMPCVVGKSMLMKKTDLEAIGGLVAVKDVLAEDYMIGKKMAESGRRVVLSGFRVQTVNHYWGMKRFLGRHTRWAKLRWKIGGARYLAELILNAPFM
ncbi:MAG: ceramide glucosyltransferase [Nitrospiraceae bacterium]|nr:ceramide glucosyltransferase [Nitrospiraceae bacterium]